MADDVPFGTVADSTLFEDAPPDLPARYCAVHLGDPMPWKRSGEQIRPSKGAVSVKGARPGDLIRAGWTFRPWIHHYTDNERDRHAGELRAAWRDAGHGRFEAGVPLELYAVFVFARPGYHYGTGRNAATVKPQHVSARPGKGGNKNAQGRRTGGDLDNLVKLLKDALSGTAYEDDGDVARLADGTEKLFTDQAGVVEPQTIIELRPL